MLHWPSQTGSGRVERTALFPATGIHHCAVRCMASYDPLQLHYLAKSLLGHDVSTQHATLSFQPYKPAERSHQHTERFTMAWPRATDSYRSLYLSRAISPQIGLKLMAFDTTRSSTLNPSGFIALTFQKVGLCVRQGAKRCRAGWHIEDPWDQAFTAGSGDAAPATPPLPSPVPATQPVPLQQLL